MLRPGGNDGNEGGRTSLRSSGLQVPGHPRPGKTTQGHDQRRSSMPRKSFGNVRNFWRQMEGGGPVLRRGYGRRLPPPSAVPKEEVTLRHVSRSSQPKTLVKKRSSIKVVSREQGGQGDRKSRLPTILETTEQRQSAARQNETRPSRQQSERQTKGNEQVEVSPGVSEASLLTSLSLGEDEEQQQWESKPAVDENEEEAASEDEDHVSHRASDNRLITPEIEEVPGDIPGTMKSRDLRSILEGDMDLRPSRQTQASLGQRSVMRNRLSAARSTLLQKLSQRRTTGRYSQLVEESEEEEDEDGETVPGGPPLPPPPPPPGFIKPASFWHTPGNKVELKRPSIFLPILMDEEKHFHELISAGNLQGVQDFLEARPSFNINCTNYQGISALHLAVKSGHEDMVEYLLTDPTIEIGDVHLYAIRDNHPIILRMLLDALHATDPLLEYMACSNSPEFAENVTPLILAAEAGHYEIIGMLIGRGHQIPVPHPPRCFCKEECQLIMKTQDPLSIASGKLHIYRAISNPAYICHTSVDPFLTAFELSTELRTCGQIDLIYIRQYEELAEAVRNFAVELIAECRNFEEVETILSEEKGSNLKSGYVYPRLILAVDLKQKEFVAHPNVQIVLERAWIGDWYAWRSYRKYVKALYILPRIFMLPVILGVLMFIPTSALAKHYSLPINKLLSAVASYSIFLVLVFIQSNVDKTNQTRDTKPTGVEIFIAIYVLTFIYNSVRSIVIEGPKRFFKFLWNVYEVIMELLFVYTFIFWITAAIRTTATGEKDVERKYWYYLDPELIAEGLFVIASIMAYLKVLLICQISYDLGPLQVSLGKMMNDCAMYSIIFAIILLAFTVGLCKFYNYYEGMFQKNEETGEVDSKQENSFTSFLDTFKTLFWGLFGMSSFEVADVVINPIKDDKGETVVNEHHFTEAVGYFVFAVYMVLAVIVILNMLIATMSNTFQKVTDNVDIEWAFGRTEVKLSYLNLPVLPPPFNIIPTTSGLVTLFKGAKDTAVRLSGMDAEKGLVDEEKVANEFSVLVAQLVQRYFSTKNETLT